jgi:Bcr/CflA subfamily drug resistance transporter
MIDWQKNESRLLWILGPLVLSVSLSLNIYVPFLTAVMETFSTSEGIVQWTVSISMFGMSLSQFIAGPLSDRIGRRKMAFMGLWIYITGALVGAFSQSITVLIIGRLLQSIGACFSYVVAYAVVKDLYSLQKSATIYSQLHSILMLSPIIAPLLGSYLNLWFGSWRSVFVFLFFFGILIFMLCVFFLPESLEKKKRSTIHVGTIAFHFWIVLKNKNFLLNAFYVAMSMIILFCFSSVSSFLLIKGLEISKRLYSVYFGLNALFFILGSFISGKVLSRWTIDHSLSVGISLLIPGALLLLLSNLYMGLSVFTLMLPMFIISVALGFILGPATAAALEDFTTTAGTAFSLLAAIQFLSAGIMNTVLLQNGIESALPFSSVILGMGVIAVILHILQRRRKSRLSAKNFCAINYS